MNRLFKTLFIIMLVVIITWFFDTFFASIAEAVNITEGDVVRESDDIDVYIIKLIGNKKFKRLILNPDVFNMYGHLKWENIKVVSPGTLESYTTSTLVKALGDEKVYKLFPAGDTGEKRWVETLDCFNSHGYDWDSVYIINSFDRDAYITGPALCETIEEKKCSDKTSYGQCSLNKPFYCENGNLTSKCSICGCPLNQYCNRSSGLCYTPEKFDMLIFISPQYRNDSEIKDAVISYSKAVKEDIGWHTKTLLLTQVQNNFEKIDEIIESYYRSDNIKASIMVGEDIDTVLGDDRDYEEAPRISHWLTLENIVTEENGHMVSPKHYYRVDITISLLYPTHELGYQTKSEHIVRAFEKFSKNRNKIYPKESIVLSDPLTMMPWEEEAYRLFGNYSNLVYKKNPSESDISSSLQRQYMIYSAAGHGGPMTINVNPDEGATFEVDYLDHLNTPIFMGDGCFVGGWFSNFKDNNKLDYSTNIPWFGSKIFVNPSLRAIILGAPASSYGNIKGRDFINSIFPDLMEGKTIAESLVGKIVEDPGYLAIIYGDPTFHYNF